MTIKKYLHSCILIEENGKRLLIDPGLFSFIEGKLKPEDIGGVDVILITHKHADHYYPEAMKKILAQKVALILANEEVGALLAKESSPHGEILPYEEIKAGDTKNIAGFTIEALAAPHGQIPGETPQNLAFLINRRILHPGDSLDVKRASPGDVLFLPVVAPWLRLVDALGFADTLKPKKVIPIHDAIMKDFMLERIYAMCANHFTKQGIDFHSLQLEEKLEV